MALKKRDIFLPLKYSEIFAFCVTLNPNFVCPRCVKCAKEGNECQRTGKPRPWQAGGGWPFLQFEQPFGYPPVDHWLGYHPEINSSSAVLPLFLLETGWMLIPALFFITSVSQCQNGAGPTRVIVLYSLTNWLELLAQTTSLFCSHIKKRCDMKPCVF